MGSLRIKTYLDHLYEMDYRERPVCIDEFLSSPQFLGNLTDQGKAVRTVWKEELSRIMQDDKKWQVVLTGGIGTGKSRAAIWGVAYVIYRVQCLKAPWKFFGGKAEGGRMTVAFFNLVKSQSQSKGYRILMTHLTQSPWFLKQGTMGGSAEFPVLHLPLFEFKLASPYSHGFGIQGDDIIVGILDELDAPDESIGQKKKVIDAYEAAANRFKTRFVFDEQSIGRLFLVASKQEQVSFLNSFVSERKNDTSVRIIDIPLWKALPRSHYCGKTFNVSLGDVYDVSRILETEEDVQLALKANKTVVPVPIEHHEEFVRNISKALRDIAGISVTELRKSKLFAAEKVISQCYDPNRKNPVEKQTIELGLTDDINLAHYINFEAIRLAPNIPRCIHWDISLSGDSSGLAMSGISGWRKIYKEDDAGSPVTFKKAVVETDFCMRFRARPGDQIPFNKIRRLIIDLKKTFGFNIVMVTADLNLLSADSRQTLTLAGIANDHLSMDTKPELYRAFRDNVCDGCWVSPLIPILHFELVNLEDDPIKNRIDHPAKVTQILVLPDGSPEEKVLPGSKDCADAVSGSVMKALELCQLPPDVEIMTSIMKQALQSATTEQAKDVHLGLVNLQQKPRDEEVKIPPKSKEMSIFLDILKRAQG